MTDITWASAAEIAAAVNANRARCFTTPPMSATPCFLRKRWLDAEMMVVSEIGARLSPRMPPERIAPAISAGSAPMAMPAA